MCSPMQKPKPGIAEMTGNHHFKSRLHGIAGFRLKTVQTQKFCVDKWTTTTTALQMKPSRPSYRCTLWYGTRCVPGITCRGRQRGRATNKRWTIKYTVRSPCIPSDHRPHRPITAHTVRSSCTTTQQIGQRASCHTHLLCVCLVH
jgi:hypothetical protein